ncbi:MAG: hypothetical protein Q9221_008031 [Calogaya cf. arnoldii]
MSSSPTKRVKSSSPAEQAIKDQNRRTNIFELNKQGLLSSTENLITPGAQSGDTKTRPSTDEGTPRHRASDTERPDLTSAPQRPKLSAAWDKFKTWLRSKIHRKGTKE